MPGAGIGACSPVTVHPQNSIALASIQLPPSLFASPVPAAPLADCKLQLLVFRNGKLFCSTGNSSRLADDGKRRSVATPVIYAGTCKGCLLAGGLGCPMWGFSWGMELLGVYPSAPAEQSHPWGSSWGGGSVPVGCSGGVPHAQPPLGCRKRGVSCPTDQVSLLLQTAAEWETCQSRWPCRCGTPGRVRTRWLRTGTSRCWGAWGAGAPRAASWPPGSPTSPPCTAGTSATWLCSW